MSDSTSQPQPSSPAPSSAESSPRYWCHHCGREVSIYMAPDPTCQVCNEQFIEELDADGGDDPRAFLSGGTTNETPSDDDVFNFFGGGAGTTSRRFQFTTEGLNPQEGEGGDGGGGGGATMNAMLQNVLSSILSGAAGGGTGNNNNTNNETEDNNTTTDGGNETTGEQQQQQQHRRTPMIFYSGMVDGNMQFRPIHLQTNTGDGQQQTEGGENPTANAFFQFGGGQEGNDNEGETGRGEGRAGLTNNMAAIVQLISAMTGAPMDTTGLVGNPNDYVFSQGALDNIITQLMEQTGGRTAPPPAPEDVIDSLPKRVLSEQEFKDQVDCAVCKDEFNQSEMVIELPCQHLFHDDCIKPWLKMNGTCPVCRHSVLPESSEANVNHGDDNASGQGQGNTETSQSNDGSATSNNQSSNRDASSTTGSTSSSTSQQNNGNNRSFAGYSWFRNPRSSTSTSSPSPSSWPANIPGAFTWGPGNNSNNNTSSHSNSQQQQQQQEDNNNEPTPEMDLDLD